jgi:hypothetical protein
MDQAGTWVIHAAPTPSAKVDVAAERAQLKHILFAI